MNQYSQTFWVKYITREFKEGRGICLFKVHPITYNMLSRCCSLSLHHLNVQARQVLHVDEKISLADLEVKYKKMYDANDLERKGSFYLQSKVRLACLANRFFG